MIFSERILFYEGENIMKLIDPVVYVEEYDGKKIMQRIERACRICYRSEGLITDDSYKKLLTN